MRDYIVLGEPRAKTLTVLSETVDGAGTRKIIVLMDYRDPILDNDPTENNKANMLTDTTQLAILGQLDDPPETAGGFVGTVDKALAATHVRVVALDDRVTNLRVGKWAQFVRSGADFRIIQGGF